MYFWSSLKKCVIFNRVAKRKNLPQIPNLLPLIHTSMKHPCLSSGKQHNTLKAKPHNIQVQFNLFSPANFIVDYQITIPHLKSTA